MVTSETPITTKTLRDFREERGWGHQQVVDAIAAVRQEEPKHWSASANYERRGLKDSDVLEALEKIYGVTHDIIKQAARNSKQFGIPPSAKRPRNTRHN